MVKEALLVIGGLSILVIGGGMLVNVAAALGKLLRLSPIVTGLTIVALGTSAPEFAVSIDAALVGSPGIAIGNVVGSNFNNVAVVLAVSAILVPVAIGHEVLRRDIPVMFAGYAALAGVMLPDGVVSRWEGLFLVAAMVTYLVVVIRISRSGQQEICEDTVVLGSVAGLLLRLLAGIILLSVGAHWLVAGGIGLATLFGVSEALIGVTVVALGTSLPELASAVIAIIRGHVAMSVGGIVGSNIWNTFGVLGTTAVIVPLSQGEVSVTMLLIMAVTGVLLWKFCATSRQIDRWEGVVLLVTFFACEYILFH